MLSSLTYVPLFTRPTRVTADSATLIDNIFTNNINDFSHSTQGILVKDISDHYPVFHINKSIPSSDIDMYIYKRIYSAGKKKHFSDISLECVLSMLNPVLATWVH